MTQRLQNPQWDTFYALRTRKRDNGLAVMPTAGPSPQPVQSVVLHGSIEFDIIAYTAAKLGEPPIVPAPASTNPNRLFLKGEQSGIFPVPEVNGATKYILSGYMIFAILNPEGLESDFMLGTLPFPGMDQNEYIAAGTYLSYTMLNQNIVPYLPNQPAARLPQVIIDIGKEG